MFLLLLAEYGLYFVYKISTYTAVIFCLSLATFTHLFFILCRKTLLGNELEIHAKFKVTDNEHSYHSVLQQHDTLWFELTGTIRA